MDDEPDIFDVVQLPIEIDERLTDRQWLEIGPGITQYIHQCCRCGLRHKVDVRWTETGAVQLRWKPEGQENE